MGLTSLSHCRALLLALADRKFHSGEDLARGLGCTRASIWKYVQQLREFGIEVQSTHGRGYRTPSPVEFLDADRVNAVLSELGAKAVPLEILPSVDSTNSHFARSPHDSIINGGFCFAEMQTAGRGRKGRTWVSPYARNLYFSVVWRFRGGPEKLLGLSLAVGVMIVDALESCGCSDLRLKWPNDVVWRGRKLGGVLIEFEGQSGEATRAVIGVGINLSMPEAAMSAVEQDWVDLSTICGHRPPRNYIAGLLISTLSSGLRRFERRGWPAYSARWDSLDCCKGRQIQIVLPAGTEEGRALGVDETGNLLVETQDGRQVYHSGDVSLRPLP